MPARVAAAILLVALATASPALAAGGGKPTGGELWRAYPLEPQTTATAASTARPSSTPAATATRTAAHAPASGGGVGWAPFALVALAAAAGASAALIRRRRRTGTPAAPTPRFTPPPHRSPRTAERLRAAVDIRHAREWPWPDGTERLWRCEIGPDPGALSGGFRAVVQPPDDEPPRVLAVTGTGPAGGDWQSAAPLERAVNALAARLEAEGWEAVEGGGDPHTRRFCWRRDGDPHKRLEESAWAQ